MLTLITLFGCSANNLTPIYNTDIKSNAVYKIGDYSFSCDITYKDNVATVVATNTRAKGLTLSYDGRCATYTNGDLSKAVPASTISPFNPSRVIYCVFSALPKANVTTKDGITTYFGESSLGDYTLITNGSTLQSLTIPNVKINIVFN